LPVGTVARMAWVAASITATPLKIVT